jgi:hypothetical protein
MYVNGGWFAVGDKFWIQNGYWVRKGFTIDDRFWIWGKFRAVNNLMRLNGYQRWRSWSIMYERERFERFLRSGEGYKR